MKTVTIYGASDDLIEVEGDLLIEVEGDLQEEFTAYEEWKYLHFDDGTVVKIVFRPVSLQGLGSSVREARKQLAVRGGEQD